MSHILARLAVIIAACIGVPNWATLYSQLSSFEKVLVDKALAKYHLVPDGQPDNKVIGKIYIFTISPFTKESGYLTLLNYLHVNTRDSVIRRENHLKGRRAL